MIYFTLLLLIFVVGVITSCKRRLDIYQIKGQIPWNNLLQIPKRFFVDVHDVVQRESQSATMHMLIAGGILLTVVLLLLAIFFTNVIYLGIITTLVILTGVLVLKKRRQGRQKNIRSDGSFLKLPIIFSIFAISILLLFIANIVNFNDFLFVVIFLFAASTMYLITFSGVLHKPLKHIFSGSMNLAFHPRPDRFSKNDTALNTIAINDVNNLGIRKVEDFSWQQRLNFDACVECGRCQDMCPAFAAGQPLNPKKFIQDLYSSMLTMNDIYKKEAYSGANHPNLDWKSNNSDDIVGGFLSADTLWSCTTCGACVYECPMMVEHVDAVVGLRRYQSMVLGNLPENSAKVLVNLRNTGTLSNHSLTVRSNWAAEFDLDVIQEGVNYDILLWIGEAGFELHNQKTLRELVSIINRQGLSVAILPQEQDCGDVARRLGDEALFLRLATENTRMLQRYTFETLLTCDPHVYHVFNREYENLDINVEHHTQFLSRIFKDQTLEKLDISHITYHDPCYLGRYNDVIESPRSLLKKVGVQVDEMERSGYRSRCCGYGGGAAFSDIPGKARIPDMRMEDAKRIGAQTIVVACPNCKTMLDAVVGYDIEVIDIVQLVNKSCKEVENATH